MIAPCELLIFKNVSETCIPKWGDPELQSIDATKVQRVYPYGEDKKTTVTFGLKQHIIVNDTYENVCKSLKKAISDSVDPLMDFGI